MYLDEVGLSREENITISSSSLNTSQDSDRLFINNDNEQDLILEDNYWQVS